MKPGTPYDPNKDATIDPTMVPVQEPTETQAFDAQGLTERGVRPTSKWDLWWQDNSNNLQDETTASAMHLKIRAERERDPNIQKITAEEANKRYPGMPEPFTGMVDPVLADLSYKEFLRRTQHAAWKGRADMGTVGGFAFDFSSGMAASLEDPMNMAMNFATAGLFAAARGSIAAAKGGMAAATAAMKAPAGLTEVVLENALQSVATEMLVRSRFEKEQQPRSVEESAFNVATGTAGGVVFHYGIPLIGKGADAILAKTREQIRAMPPGRARAVLTRMIRAHEGGQKTGNTMPKDSGRPAVAEHRAVDVDPTTSHIPIAHPSERQFYLPEHGETGTPVPTTESFGTTPVGDLPTRARNLTAGETPDTNGTVRTVEFDPQDKFTPLDSPTSDPLVTQVLDALRASGETLDVPKDATLRDVLRAIKDSAPAKLEEVKRLFAEQGVKGYTETIDTPEGRANIVHLFDPANERISESIPVDGDKIAAPSEAELDRLQAEQDAPENQRFYEPPPEGMEPGKAFVTPEGKTLSPALVEAEAARITIEDAAKTLPHVKMQLEGIDALEKYDRGLIEVVKEIAARSADSDDYIVSVREALLEKGIQASEEDLNYLADVVDDMKIASRDGVELRQKVQGFLDTDMVEWAEKRKAERVMNLKIQVKLFTAATQTLGGRKSIVDNLLDLVASGGKRRGYRTKENTHDMAAGLETQWLKRMRTVLGKNRVVAESGLLAKEITQELAALQADLPVGGSKNKVAIEIAQGYHALIEEMFMVKSGYSPYLEKTDNYFYRQTHVQEKVASVPKEEWVADALEAFGQGFGDMSDEKVIARLNSIYDAIVQGRYNSSIFDRMAGEGNIAFKLANRRGLKPDSWQSFYEYNEKYGQNVHETMAQMVRSTSRDVSVFSKFGSVPKSNVQTVIDSLIKAKPELAEEFEAKLTKFQDAMHSQTFAFERGAENLRARIMVGAQKSLTLSSNGFQAISSQLDFASAIGTLNRVDGSSYIGNMAEIFGGYAKNFLRRSKTSQEGAQEFGVFAESALRNLWFEIGGPSENSGLDKLLQLHSKITLADRHRAAMSHAIGEVVAFRMGKYVQMDWNDLPKYVRASFSDYGVSPAEFRVLKAGVDEINGRKYFTAEKLQSELLMKFADPGKFVEEFGPEILESLPRVVNKAENSAYNRPGNPYYPDRNNMISPRTGKDAGDYGADLSTLKAYNPEASAALASEIHQLFKTGGFGDHEAGVVATLYSTFFDTVGKSAGKDPQDLFRAYRLMVERTNNMPGNTLGQMSPFSKSWGRSVMQIRKGTMFDKTIIHESGHFFLETLTDVHMIDGLDPVFKKELDGLFEWLDVKDGNVTNSAHERFVNSFEVFLRTSKAPNEKVAGLFATIRDWYRRAFEFFRRGFGGLPVSLANAERAPKNVEDFYSRLMGGAGPAELHGALAYKPETMTPEVLFGLPEKKRQVRLPNEWTDLVLKMGAIVNDQVGNATTSPGSREKSMMYGRTDINTWKGALWRAAMQFKASSVKAFGTGQEVFFANPDKPNGDYAKMMKFVLIASGLWALQKQAKDFFEGKTPEDPLTLGYVAKALAGSGAGSVIADAVTQELVDSKTVRSMGTGLLRSTIPTVIRAVDAFSTLGIAGASAVSEDVKFPGGDVGRVITQNLPFQNVFWAKALLHHYALNAVREEFDNGFLRDLERRTSKVSGLEDQPQEYFMFKPTESLMWTEAFY